MGIWKSWKSILAKTIKNENVIKEGKQVIRKGYQNYNKRKEIGYSNKDSIIGSFYELKKYYTSVLLGEKPIESKSVYDK